ncbi:MAG: branched-chain amino acid transport system II carrier protein [Patescibacteria group bacterium]|nr:branched-chain amino acid transport system II carrier protein [Patescibacteria group bacterium]
MWKQRSLWLTGFTLFAMFFGAGNVTFPLLVGQHAAQYYGWAMSGLLARSRCHPDSLPAEHAALQS